jgi:hypothetical protein
MQTRIASTYRDEDGWRNAVEYMRTTMRARVNDEEAADLISYLSSTFGPDSTLPKSPEDLPAYQKLARTFTGDSTRIVYVEYEVGGKFHWSAVPDKDGNI